MKRVDGIILAAGLSTRLLGQKKIWIDVNGAPLISWALRACLASGLQSVTVVLGPSEEAAGTKEPMLSAPRLKVVINPRPEVGMSSSVNVGLSAIDPSVAGAAIILGDQPLITSDVIDRLVQAFTDNPEHIVAPFIRGRRTTPVVLPASLFPEVMRITGDVGARSVVNRHEDRVLGLEMSDVYDDTDLDTLDDLMKIRQIMSGRKNRV
jgi:molybdenum cofactor cytidylyltransferase